MLHQTLSSVGTGSVRRVCVPSEAHTLLTEQIKIFCDINAHTGTFARMFVRVCVHACAQYRLEAEGEKGLLTLGALTMCPAVLSTLTS